MDIVIAPKAREFSFRKDARRHGLYQHYFADVMLADPRIRGRILDVGCGETGPAVVRNRDVLKAARQVDGIDPFPGVMTNPYLTEKWHGQFDESAPIPEAAYDAIVSFQVVEHVGDPVRFLKTAHRVLKPGGVFFATTPHARHPFCWAVKFLEATRLKGRLAEHDSGINKIPSYYRLNSRKTVQRHAAAAGFSKATIHYFPGRWDDSFPRWLGWTADVYDWFFAFRFRPCAAQFMIALEKPAA